jgi:hypothetical protein
MVLGSARVSRAGFRVPRKQAWSLSPVLEEFPRLSKIKPLLFCPDINLRGKRPMHRAFIRNFH